MNPIEKLTEIFKEFPGIGERQARRFVYFLMARNGEYTGNLSRLITELKNETKQCKECFRFFVLKNGEKLCSICSDPNTDSTTLMVVEKDSDLESIQKSKVYSGLYFVLGGLVQIVVKNTKSFVRVEELKKKILSQKPKEIILAFSISPTGDHTDFYIRNELKDICEKNGIKISSLGRGLSTGTELEYSDNETIKNALKNRF